PAELSFNLTALRHPEMNHSIQGRTFDEHLTELILDLPRLQPITEGDLEAEVRRLRQRPPIISALPLPGFPPDRPDPAQVLIAGVPCGFRVPVLPDPRTLARRDRRPRLAFADRLVAFALVITPVAAHLLDLPRPGRRASPAAVRHHSRRWCWRTR